MGMLPIALAIIGFVFLWAIVNYNSLKQKSDTLNKAHEDLREIAMQRHSFLLLIIHELSQPLSAPLSAVVEGAKKHSLHNEQASTIVFFEQQSTASAHIAKLEENSSQLLSAGASQKSLEDLFQMNARMIQMLKKHRLIKKHYNELVLSIPTRFIAGISGFHVR